MSTQTQFTQSRRNFLKGAAYTSVLSIGGVSSLAFAAKGKTAAATAADTANAINADISVMQQPMLHKETVSLFNNSDEPVMLDAMQPIKIDRVNGSLVVKPNVISDKAYSGMIMIHPRERLSFDIQTTGGIFSSAEVQDARLLDGQLLHISSEHSAFNRLIPVSNTATSIV